MADRPNIVFMMSDQQRYDTLACYGADYMNVPNLNALANRSFVFRNAYVAQPVCTPARATIMTGLYPHAAGPIVNKIHLPLDTPVIAEMIDDEYLKGYMGKWHLGNDVQVQHGFDVWNPTEDGHRETYTKAELRYEMTPFHQHLVENGYEPDGEHSDGIGVFSGDARQDLPKEFQMAHYLGDSAAEFIEENKDRPFILYVSTFEPHSPYHGPYMDMYDPEEIPVGDAFLKLPEGASRVNRVRADYFMQFMLEGKSHADDDYMTRYAAVREDVTTEQGWRTLRAHYLANITLVDDMVGKITDALEKAGVADNTVVVFTSEHGDMMGDHGMLEKRSFFEEASRVPLLMSVPWLSKEQTIVEGSVGHIDLVPTLLELSGNDVPDSLQGKSLVPVLKGEQTLDDNDVFVQWNGTSDELPDRFLGSREVNRMLTLPGRSVITPDRWKLNICAGDQGELFDLNNDPAERNNLYNDPAQRDRIIDMAARIRIWQHETGDTAPLPSV